MVIAKIANHTSSLTIFKGEIAGNNRKMVEWFWRYSVAHKIFSKKCLTNVYIRNKWIPSQQVKTMELKTHTVIQMSKKCFACYVPEKITFTNAPSPQEFTEGDNANIVCDVTSSPPPTVLWKFKGAKIQMEKDGKIFWTFHLIWCLVPVKCSMAILYWIYTGFTTVKALKVFMPCFCFVLLQASSCTWERKYILFWILKI